ncbi:MAG: hypothetical protein R6V45_06085 [Oceanipulchritudo sp.]
MIRVILILAILLQAFGGLLAMCPVEKCAADPAGMPATLAGACCPESNQDAGMPGGHGRCLCTVSAKLVHGVADRGVAKPSVPAPEQVQETERPVAREDLEGSRACTEADPGYTMSPAEWRSWIRVRLI